METPQQSVDWAELHGVWMLLQENLHGLFVVSGGDLKLAGNIQTGIEAIDEVFRRVQQKATLAAALEDGETEATEKKPLPPILARVNSRDDVG